MLRIFWMDNIHRNDSCSIITGKKKANFAYYFTMNSTGSAGRFSKILVTRSFIRLVTPDFSGTIKANICCYPAHQPSVSAHQVFKILKAHRILSRAAGLEFLPWNRAAEFFAEFVFYPWDSTEFGVFHSNFFHRNYLKVALLQVC